MKMNYKTIALFMILLVMMLPVSFAVTINPDSINIELTETTAEISWETDVNATGYVEYAETGSDDIYEVPSTQGEGINHSVLLYGLDPGMKYYYQISAEDESGTYTTTSYDFTTTLPAVENLEAVEVTYDYVSLEWDELDNARSYNLYRDDELIEEIMENMYTDENVSAETAYTYKVAGVSDADLEGNFSDPLEVETPEGPVDITFIQTTDITKNTAALSFTLSRASNATVYYGTTEDFGLEVLIAEELEEHEIIFKELLEDTTYFFEIEAGPSVSDRYDFTTMSNESQIEISEIEVKDITRETAEVHWKTNIETSSEVYYSIDDSLDQKATDEEDVIYHVVELESLLGGTTYYYKVKSGAQESEIMDFTTSEHLSDFLNLDPVPELVYETTLVVSGTTEEHAKLYAWVNRDSSPMAQVIITDVEDGYFEIELELSPYSYIDEVTGKNIVEINSWDEEGAKAVSEFEIVVDNIPPSLSVTHIPEWVNDPDVNITGYTDSDATIEIFIGESSQGETTVDENGYFERVINVGTATKPYNITITARDEAGNENSIMQEINVDMKDPSLDFYTSFSGETHYKIFRIDGKTEPNAHIIATNFGPYQGCDDVSFTEKFGSCEQIADVYGAGPDQEITFGGDVPHTLMTGYEIILGQPTGVYADDEGNFSILVALYSDPEKIGMVGRNNIQFNITDQAGNFNIQTKAINYRPACPEWILGKISSFPLNLYTEDMKAGDIDGSAIIELDFLGAGSPGNVQIRRYFDDDAGTLITEQGSLTVGTGTPLALTHSLGGLSNSNSYFKLGELKQTQFDETNRKVYVYIPVIANKYTGKPEDLPDQMGVYLDLRIEYQDYLGQTATCDLYPVLSFPVQKPETLLKWLSPTMLEATVEFLDKSIDVTQAAVEFLTKASRWTLVACGALIAYNYAKGLFGGGTAGEQVCMKEVYWTCDRILCPPVPDKCESLTPMDNYVFTDIDGNEVELPADEGGKLMYDEQITVNNAYMSTLEQDWKDDTKYSKYSFDNYLKSKLERTDDKDYDEFKTKYDNAGAEIRRNNPDIVFTDYRTVSSPNVYTMEYQGKEVTVSYYGVDEQLPGSRRTAAEEFGVGDCPMKDAETLIVIQGLDQRDVDFLAVGEAQLSRTVRCSTDDKETLLEEQPPEEQGFPGCFDAECPQFDKSKCLLGDGAGLNPTNGLLVSIQCGCLPAAKAHLENILKLMMSAKLCFEAALEGETTAGACERLLSYFVCDILTEIFKFLLEGLTGAGGRMGSYVSPGYQNFRAHSAAVTQDISSRYGPVMGRLGLTTDQLVNNACIGAFTGDWSLLEGALDAIVDTVEVRPMYTADVTSRPYGYDPFTGRISIGYNVYFGLISGGDTYITATLECDRGMSGGEYCAQGQTPIDLTRETPIPGYLSKGSDWNENTFYIDSNAKSWYNKMVLEIKYRSGQEYKTERKEYSIRKKGDLSLLNCRLSTTAGIACEVAPEFMDIRGGEIGSVTLYSNKQGSTLSPDIRGYYGPNQIAGLVKIKNGYGREFFLSVDDGSKVKQYSIIGGVETTELQEDQWYNIWLGDVMGVVDSEYGYLLPWKQEGTDQGVIKFTDSVGDYTNESVSFRVGIPTTNLNMIEMKLHLGQLTSTGIVEDKGFVICEAATSSVTGSYENEYAAMVDGILITIDETTWETVCNTIGESECSTNWNSVSTSIREKYHRIGDNPAYYMCIKPEDDIKADRIVQIDFLDHRKQDYDQDISKYDLAIRDAYLLYNNNELDKRQTISAIYSGSTSQTAGMQNVRINVLEDVNGNGCGETMIYSADARDPNEQEFTFSYRLVQAEAPSNSPPSVHFIEPITIIEDTTGYVNNDGMPVPIGFNLWDDRNEIKEIEIGIYKSSDKTTCSRVYTYDETQDLPFLALEEDTSRRQGECTLVISERTTGFIPGEPPFFEFDLYPEEGIITTGEDDLYEITIKATDENDNSNIANLAKRRIRFDPLNTEARMTREDVMVCLGSGMCSGTYSEHMVCHDIIQGPGTETGTAYTSPELGGDVYGPYPEFED